MPTRLLLDGDDLAALMHRVREEMGPNAVVVRAERVRTGGVAGFFAKEHYELTVEVPEPKPRTPRRLPAGRPGTAAGMAALLDAADAAEARSTHGSTRGPGTPGDHPVHPVIVAPPSADLPATDDATPATPRVSTDAVNFASLLASIDVMAGPPSAPVPAVPVVPAVPAVPLVAPGPVANVLPGAQFLPGALAAPPTSPGLSAGRSIPPDRSSTLGGDRRALLELGVPASLLGSGPLDETVPLSELLAQLVRPPALLRAPGSIIAVVGESAQALAVAAQLAVRVRQDPHEVVLAGVMPGVVGHYRRLLSQSAAAMYRTRVGDGEQISIVAVGVGPEAQDWPLAAELLADLGPDQAWAVVDARRKTSDLRTWLRVVGSAREFDVAAAASVHETQEPGTMLDLGVPVGWIDGLPATPIVWAAVLSERLEPGARWD
ncbi:MAG: hypothetical protein ACOH2F_15525 [Cellulomonas sp.]